MTTSEAPEPTLPDTLSDPVDLAHYYWREHMISGDAQRFLAISALLRYQRLIVDGVEAELRTHKLNLTDYLVLMTLQLSENGIRLISDLARSLMVHATTATLATDRLQKRRLISRSPHPTDRRATCITITAPGRKLVRKATAGLSEIGFGMGSAGRDNAERLVTLLGELRNAAGDTRRGESRTAPPN